jgi:hypothetical protein
MDFHVICDRIWKSLMVITHSESPVVVVLRYSPAAV